MNFLRATGAFYGAVIGDDSLWNSSALRDNNGPWTTAIRELSNKYVSETALGSFFDGWTGGSAALDAAVTPDYRLNTVYSVGPERALTDMVLEAGAAETEDVITAEEDVTAYEWGKLAVSKGVLSATDFEEALSYGTEGDTLSLAEHHIYGSSRLGVQRYDSLGLANITHLPEAEATHVRTTLNNRNPWYSYAYADLIDSTKRVEYDATVNTYTGTLYNSRNLGRRYYELTDHLGNVLATVLDRKTGSKASPEATLYDHWSADLASVADYYPGGMMMPGRNLEHDWSRMGSQSQQKDDEIYGKGNIYAFKYRMEDARINRFFSVDPLHGKYPHYSDYSFSGNRLIDCKDVEGLEETHFTMQLDKAFSTAGSAERWHKDNAPLRPYATVAKAILLTATVGLPAPEAVPYFWRGAAMLSNPASQEIIVGGAGLTASLLDPNPANDYPGGLDNLANAGRMLFKSSGTSRFIFNGNRLNFFFWKRVRFFYKCAEIATATR